MNLETWLNDMSARPMPGGVAASAFAAAMGAALIAKALRISLRREPFADDDRERLSEMLALARSEQAALFELAQADTRAYRAVIAAQSLAAGDPAREEAWQWATDVPLTIAETCRRLLEQLEGVMCQCWEGVCVDYQIGAELLGAAAQAGALAAEANLDHWGPSEAAEPLHARLAALVQALRNKEDDDG